METLTREDRDALDKLIKQRESLQIGEVQFEKRKRQILGLPPVKVPVLLNALIIGAIAVVLFVASSVFYPVQTKIGVRMVVSLVTNWESTSAFAIPGKVNEVKESADQVADQLFADPVGWSQ